MEITALAHLWIEPFLRPDGLAIDATVGNGYDSVFLAERLGPEGRVYGFDVQGNALEAAGRRLATKGLAERVTLFHRSHAEMTAALAAAVEERQPCAIMFNLGYLPGGNKKVTTRVEVTLPAVSAALELLAPGGGISIVLYPGHAEGGREFAAISQWAEDLPGRFEATICRVVNRKNAPCLVAVEKRM